jgi:hypothetical protein
MGRAIYHERTGTGRAQCGVACKVELPNDNCQWLNAVSRGSAGFTLSSTINLQRFYNLSGRLKRTAQLPSFLGSVSALNAFSLRLCHAIGSLDGSL